MSEGFDIDDTVAVEQTTVFVGQHCKAAAAQRSVGARRSVVHHRFNSFDEFVRSQKATDSGAKRGDEFGFP